MDKHELEAYRSLCDLNIPAHIRGYTYIKTALNHLREHPESLYAITKELYPGVAEIHGVEVSQVERGIRNAINHVKDDEAQFRALGRTGHLSNAEFLATLSEAIRIKLGIEGNQQV